MVVISCALQLLVADGSRLLEDKVLLINVELSSEVEKQLLDDNREVVELGWEMLLLFWKVSPLNFESEIFTSDFTGKVFETFDCLRPVFSLLVLSFFSKTCTVLSAASLSLLSSLILSFKFFIVSAKLSILCWRL